MRSAIFRREPFQSGRKLFQRFREGKFADVSESYPHVLGMMKFLAWRNAIFKLFHDFAISHDFYACVCDRSLGDEPRMILDSHHDFLHRLCNGFRIIYLNVVTAICIKQKLRIM